MRSPLFLLGLALVAPVMPPALAGPTWQKSHQTVQASPGGATVVEFTTIAIYPAPSNPSEYPWDRRVLYMDDAGRRLVLRDRANSETSFINSVECLPGGETLVFETVADQSLTVRFGAASLVLNAADVGRSADRLPPALLDRASALIAPMSEACKSTLLRFVSVGTTYAVDLFVDASTVGEIFFPGAVTEALPEEPPPAPTNVVRPFVPSRVPPDAFERRFGDAYFR